MVVVGADVVVVGAAVVVVGAFVVVVGAFVVVVVGGGAVVPVGGGAVVPVGGGAVVGKIIVPVLPVKGTEVVVVLSVLDVGRTAYLLLKVRSYETGTAGGWKLSFG